MKTSKYVKLANNILLEYIYDDTNLIGEPYEILYNIKSNSTSFISTDTSATTNIIDNQLFQIDPITRTYGLVGNSTNGDVTNYPFLQLNNYASGFPIKYDTIIIHLPINYTFDQYLGFYLRIYSFDAVNNDTHDLSNFYFDISNPNTKYIMQYTNPPMFFQEQLWGKEIVLIVPSLFGLSTQVSSNKPLVNSVNYNLTKGVGMNQQTPIFFDFSFITNKQVINSITTYNLSSPIQYSIPQIPEFQKLGVMIEHASDGDYFNIYGTYNDTIADFNIWINNAVYIGNRYFVNYTITTYEQNIRGNSYTITVTDNFNIPIEFRPTIKISATTAVIDVEMDVIDAVDNSTIIRNASYGMLQNEVSKYSRNLTKINLDNATKPIIYNLKSIGNSNISTLNGVSSTNIISATVSYTVLMDSASVVAKSDNVIVGNTTFYGEGKLVILIKPFDNVIKITIANNITTQNNNTSPKYINLTNLGTIQLVFKNSNNSIAFDTYLNNNQIDLANGTVVFLIQSSKIQSIRSIYTSGVNVFYITSTQNNITSSIYSGLFKMYDSSDNIASLNANAAQISSNNTIPSIIPLNPNNVNNQISPTTIVTPQVSTNTISVNTRLNNGLGGAVV